MVGGARERKGVKKKKRVGIGAKSKAGREGIPPVRGSNPWEVGNSLNRGAVG